MATTGANIAQNWRRIANLPINVYYNPVKLNSLFKDALVACLEFVYRNLEGNDYNSKINSIISTGDTFPLINNQINIFAGIPNYYKLLGAKFSIKDDLNDYSIKSVTKNPSTGLVTITFKYKTPLRGYAGKAEQLLLISFMSASNVEVFVKQNNDYDYELYMDPFFKTKFVTAATYSSGIVTRIVKKWAKPYLSNSKGNYYGDPSLLVPKYEIADGNIKAYPDEYNIYSMELDYLTTPPLFIDTEDALTDVEQYYPIDFIRMFTDKAVELYKQETGNAMAAPISTINVLKD